MRWVSRRVDNLTVTLDTEQLLAPLIAESQERRAGRLTPDDFENELRASEMFLTEYVTPQSVPVYRDLMSNLRDEYTRRIVSHTPGSSSCEAILNTEMMVIQRMLFDGATAIHESF